MADQVEHAGKPRHRAPRHPVAAPAGRRAVTRGRSRRVRPARTARLSRTVVALTLAAITLGGLTSAAAGAFVDNTTVIYDVYGQRLDAHDGDLLQGPDGTLYLYGTSYGCGFRLGVVGSAYCGVRIYSTRDLRTFTPAGSVGGMYAFDHLSAEWQTLCAPPAFGCFRPHVVRRPADGRYVMWLNVHSRPGYVTMVADSPAGPFAPTGITPTLAVDPGSGLRWGDHDVTIAPDGRGYLTYTVIDPTTNAHALVIEELDPTLTIGTARHQVLDIYSGTDLVESPGLFYGPNGAWYLTYSDPARPYMVTGTGIVNGPRNTNDPLSGPWSSPRTLNPTSCSGQPTGVWSVTGSTGATTFVYGSDRWEHANPNQTRANSYFGALTFRANGGTAVDGYICQPSWVLP